MAIYSAERRQHDRLYHHTTVNLTTPFQDSVVAHTINLSNGGLLIKGDLNPLPKIGDIIKVQSMAFPDASIKSVIVRRIVDPGIFGTEFIEPFAFSTMLAR